MTYGDLVNGDLRKRTPRTRRERKDFLTVFVEGDPVPFMGYGEDHWSWSVERAMPDRVSRPKLSFVLDEVNNLGVRFGLDELAKPVLDACARHARSLWVETRTGTRLGVRVADGAPPYPPRIDYGLELVRPPGHHGWASDADIYVPGEGPVGVYLSFPKGTNVADCGFGSPIRGVFDALSPVLGGSYAHAGDYRIREVRAVWDPGRMSGVEVKLWRMDR